MNHFLPKTTTNVSTYVSELEHKFIPRAAEIQDTAIAHSKMTWEIAKEKTSQARESVQQGVVKAVDSVQDATGLQLREAFGWSRSAGQDIVRTAEARGKLVVSKLEEGAEEAKSVVQKKIDEVGA